MYLSELKVHNIFHYEKQLYTIMILASKFIRDEVNSAIVQHHNIISANKYECRITIYCSKIKGFKLFYRIIMVTKI